MDFIDAAHGWVCGEVNAVLTTKNGGATWVERVSPIVGNLRVAMTDVAFADATRGWGIANWQIQSPPGR